MQERIRAVDGVFSIESKPVKVLQWKREFLCPRRKLRRRRRDDKGIDLAPLRRLMGTADERRKPSFKHRAPDYVRFERPPVVEAVEPFQPVTGEPMQGEIKYYEYGVVSAHLELGFTGSWGQLIELASRWIGSPDIEQWTERAVRRHLEPNANTLAKPYDVWLSEDYYIIHVRQALSSEGQPATAKELLSDYGAQICQIVRGESRPLSADEQRKILQDAVSYYPDDLAVIGWTADFLYDTPEGADPTRQLLEYANTQLLKFRHYDVVLTHVLDDVYNSLEENRGLRARWRSARRARELNTIRFDIRELIERSDNTIKFLSDMFYARLYRRPAIKVGVPDYRNLIEDNLRTAGELYTFLVDQFNEGRAFVLEAMIVIILIIDLVFLFQEAFL